METTLLPTLVRKDARSLGGKAVAMTLILVSVVISTIAHDPAGAIGVVNVFLGMYAVGGAIFIAMDVAVGERTDGTLAFSRALPVPRGAIAASRIGVGLIACVVPIVVVVLVLGFGVELAAALEDGRSVHWPGVLPQSIIVSGSVALGSATMVYLVTVAAGARQPSELRAAAMGLGLLLAWLVVIPFVRIPHLDQLLVLMSPLGLLVAVRNDGPWLTTILVQTATGLVLLGLALGRYGRPPVARHGKSMRASRRSVGRLGGPWIALGWKEAREALPVVGLGLAVTVFLTSWLVVAETHGAGIAMIDVLERTLTVVSYGLATLVALIVGVGAFASELQPGLYEFWRTRPIGVTRWYGLKMLTAGGIILVVFTIPVIAVLAFKSSTTTLDGVAFLACAPPLVVFTLATAIAITCVARHALYAAILSVAALLVVVIAPTYTSGLDAINIFEAVATSRDMAQRGRWPLSPQYLGYAGSMLGLAALATAVGLVAVRRNWHLGHGR